jgi:hypothetical protein
VTFTQQYSARVPYLADHRAGPHRLVIAVACQLGTLPAFALLDTAADWCVLPPAVATELGFGLDPDPAFPPYSTRHGLLFGRQERMPVIFLPEAGDPLEIDATWFISPDWPGPIVVGWKGCLERIRFALSGCAEWIGSFPNRNRNPNPNRSFEVDYDYD